MNSKLLAIAGAAGLLVGLTGPASADANLWSTGHVILAADLDTDSEGPGHSADAEERRSDTVGVPDKPSATLDTDSEGPGHSADAEERRSDTVGVPDKPSATLDTDSEGPGHSADVPR